MSSFAEFFDFLKENGISFVDFRFTDLHGKWHHIARPVSAVDEDILRNGIGFDGSSIEGWKEIHYSDMYFIPDVSTVFVDPFFAQPTASVFCDVYEPNGKNEQIPYQRCPRFIAKKAEEYLKNSSIATTAFFGPEPEFFVFDEVDCKMDSSEGFYSIKSSELGNLKGDTVPKNGHRPQTKGGYFPTSPVDHGSDIRSEMVNVLQSIGINAFLHHHEVAPAQYEIGFEFSTLLKTADNTQKFKYGVKNVADSYGKTATFMPKPIFGDNGSGMHVHQSIWRDNVNLFVDYDSLELSETALYYIGGIIRHGKALNAFTNPTVNSYKRLVPHYEAPVFLAYAEHNRSASIRIPYSVGAKAKRIETRFPDPLANPYLAFSALLLAGLDGILNKIHPGEASKQNLYELTEEQEAQYPKVASSLQEALIALNTDRVFLTKTGVFTDDFIDTYIKCKKAEIAKVQNYPTPAEFVEYFSN
jgi:glutamine synthetase